MGFETMARDRQETANLLLQELGHGRREAFDELIPLIYDELRELAHRQRRGWRGNDTLNTTALVHEAYLKLVGRDASWDSEPHFLAAAARAVRHILINYARDRRTQKRGGRWQRVSLSGAELPFEEGEDRRAWEDEVLALDEALERLAARSERQSRIVECRFYAGMTTDQTATALGLSTATVSRGWAVARAWLHRELGGAADREDTE
jgi:RNA polymerase sigma factor (TIGR02999 family)